MLPGKPLEDDLDSNVLRFAGGYTYIYSSTLPQAGIVQAGGH